MKPSENSMELQSSQLSEYNRFVKDVLQHFYAQTLRPLPSNIDFITSSWAELFIHCGIPASKLMSLYLDTKMGMQAGDYFNADLMVKTWNEQRTVNQIDKINARKCPICKGTKKILKFDFTSKVDKEIECSACS